MPTGALRQGEPRRPAGLLRRFRPGQSLDAELDAFERERGRGAPSRPSTARRQTRVAANPAADGRSRRPPSRVDRRSAAAAASPSRGRPRRAGAGAARRPPTRPAADVVEQPTWRITAPDRPARPSRRHPPAAIGGRPAPGERRPADARRRRAAVARSARSGPTRPGSAGLPFLGRPAHAAGRHRRALGRVEPGARDARRPRRRAARPSGDPAVHQLRAVTLRHRPVLPALRHPPGPLTRRRRAGPSAGPLADPDPGRAEQQRLERERQPGERDERRRERPGQLRPRRPGAAPGT